jgi:DNA-binding response OmpR family regulator
MSLSGSPRRAGVLVVDDDANIRALLRLYLERAGHRVTEAADGESALRAATVAQPDLVILDLMLPGIDGVEVARLLRRATDAPILMLSARSGESDKVLGLDVGADDYVVKPFSPRELMARVRALLRRRAAVDAPEPVLETDGLRLDPSALEVRVDGRAVELTASEFRLLHALMSRPMRVFSRDELIGVMHPDDDPGILDRTIDVHLGRLRRKLAEDGSRPRWIGTVRSFGYRFLQPVTRVEPGTSAGDP